MAPQEVDLEAAPSSEDRVDVHRVASHATGPEGVISTETQHLDTDDAVYDRLPRRKKSTIVAVVAFCAFLSPMSSTSVLAAVPEVAADFHTNGSVINVSNAAYMVLMGFSSMVWGPMSQVFGRRPVLLLTAALFFVLSVGTALSPNLAAFFVFRSLSAFEGTAFITLGASCVGDIYRPTERGTAIGWFLTGTVVGPAFGPFFGGVIVTFTSWRIIFWLQTALAGVGAVCIYFFVPETSHRKLCSEFEGLSRRGKVVATLGYVNPVRVIALFKYPNQLLAGFATGALTWNMYTLLTPIRYVLNPRFHLESPVMSGLFYLAPGCGYIIGTLGGGRWADHVVKKWIRRRNGERIPEDRLRSSLPFLGCIIPGCILIYGWSVDKKVGGIPLPVIVLFIQGVAQLFAFPSINAYCLDVMPGRGADVTAGNYAARYLAAAIGTAVVLPAVDSIGVGWFCTISAAFLCVAGVGIMATIRWGGAWRAKLDENADTASPKSNTAGPNPPKA